MSNKAYSSYTIVDVTDGLNWLGELDTAPSPAKQGDAYYNTKEKKSYLHDGNDWVVFSYDAPEGRNYILNSANLMVSGLGASPETGPEYQPLNVGQSYMHIEHGTQVTISFDLEMMVHTANPLLTIYNTHTETRKGPKQIQSVKLRFEAAAGSTIKQRCSATTTILDRENPKATDNYIEFYAWEYGSGNVFKITNLKLERGKIATPWSPAPEDALQYEATLSNENATISTDKDGKYDAAVLKAVSTIEVKVTKGTENITNQCTFAWTATGGALNNIGSVTNNSFKSLTADTGTATITITLPNKETITKTFTISKNKQGVPGANGEDGISVVEHKKINSELETEIYYHTSSSEPPTATSAGGTGSWPWQRTRTKDEWQTIYSNDTVGTSYFTYSSWSEWELACTNASDVKAFNTLTNNGQFEGHFYGVYMRGELHQPGVEFVTADTPEDAYYYKTFFTDIKAEDIMRDELWVIWNGINKIERAEPNADNATKVVDNSKNETLKSFIDYYVNASMIQTGSLLVGTDEKPILMAGFDNNTVKIAGFDVSDHSLENDTNGYVYLGTDAIKLGGNSSNPIFSVNNQGEMQMTKGSIKLGGNAHNPVFSVDENGTMQMTKGSIKLGAKSGEHHPFEVNDQGEMYSIKGNVGGWNINEVGLYNSTPEQQVYLKRIYYSFAQGDSSDQTVENASSLTYQDSLINLSSFYPIFVKRTFDYGSFTLSTITKMTIRTQQSTDTQITAYNIYYSNDKSVQLPLSVDNPGAFQRWSNWLPTRNELYDYICVDWSVGTDSGFDPLVPYGSETSVSSSAGIFTLTDYRLKPSAYYFGCNSDENIQNSSLLDNSNSAIVFYAGGNILNLQEAAFQVLRDGSVYMKALQVDRLISKGQELNFGVVTKYTGGNTYRSGITMYSGDTQLLTQSAYGFYIGFDGANFGQLYLSGKKVNIDASDGHLYIIT